MYNYIEYIMIDYMKKLNYKKISISIILSALFILSILLSCSSENHPCDNNDNTCIDSTKQETMQLIFPSQISNFIGVKYSAYMHLTAYTQKELKRLPIYQALVGVNKGYGGRAIVSNFEIQKSGHGYEFGFPTLLDTTNMKTPVFGNVSNWSFSGNPEVNFEGFQTNLYVPKNIEFQSEELGFNNDLSVNKGVGIKWNKDVNNKNGVWIWFWYKAKESFETDSTLPKEDFYWYKNVKDVGYYFLKLSSLKIPSKGYVDIRAIRFDEKLIITKNDTILLRAETYTISSNKLSP
jgi:hypothetical protein